MQTRRSLTGILIVVAWMGLMPARAWAQSAIAGLVKDTSGAVMPGVTVEAASPALIEKVRSVVTDGQGQYKIVDLRPGVGQPVGLLRLRLLLLGPRGALA